MRHSVRRKRRDNRLVVAVGLVLSAAIIWQASFAAFTTTTSNTGNSWATGQLGLTLEDGSGGAVGAAVFSATGWRPGDSLSRCITVKFTGNIAAGSAVKIYGAAGTSSAAVNGHTLSSYLNLVIDEGTGATNTSCAGFALGTTLFNSTTNNGPVNTATVLAGSVMDFYTNKTNHTSGIATGWTPAAANETKTYRFTVGFPGSGSNATDSDLMNMTAGTTFTWEVQS